MWTLKLHFLRHYIPWYAAHKNELIELCMEYDKGTSLNSDIETKFDKWVEVNQVCYNMNTIDKALFPIDALNEYLINGINSRKHCTRSSTSFN